MEDSLLFNNNKALFLEIAYFKFNCQPEISVKIFI